MPRPTKKKRQSRQLILGHLERISSKIFSDFPKQLTDLVGQQHGIYALYKSDRLHYVGLASNLRRRIKWHLRDRHAGKWDRFSLYLVHKADHIKELESLILRVADPTGNAVKGRLRRAEDLTIELQRRVRAVQDVRLEELLGKPKRVRPSRKPKREPRTRPRETDPPLLQYTRGKRFRIRGLYKGKAYVASVRSSGRINYKGQLYKTPSGAGDAARSCRTNGWRFWCFRKRGQWAPLDELRRR